jgi:uncharacterized protein
MPLREPYAPLVWMGRWTRSFLIRPMLRAKHPPEYAARASAIGIFMALTPTIGVQIPTIAALWALLRTLRDEHAFSLPLAVAWTLPTNAFTLPPVYYVFLVTGQILLGRWEEIGTYSAVVHRLSVDLDADATWVQALWAHLFNLFDAFGFPLFVGCLPWAIGGAWLGYALTLRLIRARRALRVTRAHRRPHRGDVFPDAA